MIDRPVQGGREIVEVDLAGLEQKEGEPGGGMRGHTGSASHCSLSPLGPIRGHCTGQGGSKGGIFYCDMGWALCPKKLISFRAPFAV